MQTQEMVQMYRDGAPLTKISKEAGISHVKVLGKIRQFAFEDYFKDRISKVNQAIADLVKENPNVSVQAIASQFNISPPNANKILKRLGISTKTRIRTTPLTPDQAKIITNYYNNGLGVEKIAFRTGISPSVIRNFLAKAGLIQAKNLTPEEINKIFTLRENGLSIFQIAKELNRSSSVISRHIKAKS